MTEALLKKTKKNSKSIDPLKIPPHSIEAEQSIIGGLMLDNGAWDTVVSKVQSTDFYRYEHRLIFEQLMALSKKEHPFDVVMVMEALKSVEQLDQAGGELYLFELANNTPSVANIAAYADIVREKSVMRQLIAVANDIASTAFKPEGQSVADILDEAESKVFAITEQSARDGGPVSVKELLTKAVDRIEFLYQSKSTITGLATGFDEFDNKTTGLQPSDLIIVAGRPSMGKTAFAMNIAEQAAIAGDKAVLVFSMEMPGDSLAMRMMSSLGRINQQKLRTGQLDEQDWPRIASPMQMLSQAPLFIDDTPAQSPAEVRARARRAVREHGELGLIVIDYLQLMRVPGIKSDNRVAEISEISRSLKALAKELNVPVIALSQLNRSLEQRTDKRPVMSDLRESGAIEQDADLIVFIYRDEVYNDESPDKGTAEIIISKQRNGPIGKVRLSFQGQYTRFDNLAYDSHHVATS